MGWGKSEDKYRDHEEVPREVQTKAVNDSICFSEDHSIGKLKSGRMFCGTGEGQGPCRGDSGKKYNFEIEICVTLIIPKGVAFSSDSEKNGF